MRWAQQHTWTFDKIIYDSIRTWKRKEIELHVWLETPNLHSVKGETFMWSVRAARGTPTSVCMIYMIVTFVCQKRRNISSVRMITYMCHVIVTQIHVKIEEGTCQVCVWCETAFVHVHSVCMFPRHPPSQACLFKCLLEPQMNTGCVCWRAMLISVANKGSLKLVCKKNVLSVNCVCFVISCSKTSSGPRWPQ